MHTYICICVAQKVDAVKRDVHVAAVYSKSTNPWKKTDVLNVEFELTSVKKHIHMVFIIYKCI